MTDYDAYDKGALLKERYRKVADISEGSYGLVTVAKDTRENDKLVAVKYIYPLDYKSEAKPLEVSGRATSSPAKLRSSTSLDLLATKSKIQRKKAANLQALYEEADKEIKIHNILGSHTNITLLYDHFDSCLVLEYCSRGDLYEAIQNGKGPTTSRDIKDVFYQILNALDYCHSQEVFHRDLKPENILIGEDWSIKLCDWGLATTTRTITNKNEFDIGSERYMAPELFDQELEYYDASKIDLWSIGIILLTLVFHKNPFQVANYSDKRFQQFTANREVLFDIFSTMSGEMFSVLRYCLNMDPTNRDLKNLRSELDSLKYFTADEEYWDASEGDYDDEGEEEDEEDPIYQYFKDISSENGTFKDSGEKNISIVVPQTAPEMVGESTPIISTNIINIDTSDHQKESFSATDGEETSTSTATGTSRGVKHSRFDESVDMPHNHRADALLLANTDLKPIPISNGGLRFIRNTRKPFNVASFGQSTGKAPLGSHNGHGKFNREDFFTPKSVFNHYMDKYGEQRFGGSSYHGLNHHGGSGNSHSNSNGGSGFNNRQQRTGWKRSKKRAYWKRPSGSGPVNNGLSSGKFNKNPTKGRQQASGAGRRKTHLFSSKSRPNLATTPNGMSGLSNGKYVPPFLRSPNLGRLPMVRPLTEDIDNLTLDNNESTLIDDEVFHLEDDFLLDVPTLAPAPTSEPSFKKPAFKVPTYTLPLLEHQLAPGSHSGQQRQRRHLIHRLAAPEKDISSGAKYVPPFRRGLHSLIVPVKACNPKASVTAKRRSGVFDTNNGLGRATPKHSMQVAALLDDVSLLAPLRKTDWFPKKEWSDWDDE